MTRRERLLAAVCDESVVDIDEHVDRVITVVCRADDLHPYECDGPGSCSHCDRDHNPELCELCQSEGRS